MRYVPVVCADGPRYGILPARRTLYSPTGEVYPMGWGSRGSGNSMNLCIQYSGFTIFYIQ